MSGYQNRNNMGEQIKGALAEALQSGDFSKLNDLVSQTVNNTINEVRSNIAAAGESISGKEKCTLNQQNQQTYEERQRKEQERLNKLAWESHYIQEKERQKRQKQLKDKFRIKRIGNVSSVLYQVFGGIGLGITGIVTLVRFLFHFTYDNLSAAGWILNLIFLIFFYCMIQFGINQRNRLKRAERYVRLCDHKMYKNIRDLASDCGRSERFVVKDIQKMMRLGFFPEGHMDADKTCFMLSDAIYRQYLDTEENRRRIEEESRLAAQKAETSQALTGEAASEISNEQSAELNSMIAEGTECIRKLRELNDKIPGEVISVKLFRLESLLKEIFNSIREHPEQMHRMHKLMDYYLPTTLKLVESYEEFDRVSAPGEEIIRAKAEIENTLDTINQAFTELLNNLFQDTVFDATTDAQVLKTMLAREGLMKEPEFATLKRD